MTGVVEQIEPLLEPILRSLGLFLWELEYRKEGPRWMLRIFIDREGAGATLDDCEAVSRDLGALLDVEDIVPHAYTLEVSSPGLDRALTRPEHYARCAGSMVRIKTFQPVNGQKVFRGRLKSSDGMKAAIELDDGSLLDVPYSGISRASLEIEV
jgi:ribosome maturation factor RimP